MYAFNTKSDNLGRTTIRTSSASPVIPFGKCTRWTFCCIITQEARLPFALVMLCYGTTVQMEYTQCLELTGRMV